MRLSDSPLGLRRDLRLVNVVFAPSAGDEIPGIGAGGRPRLRIPALVSVVNYILSLALPSGRLVMIGVDVVLLAHNYSSETSRVGADSSRYCHVTNKFGAYVASFHCFRASQRVMKALQEFVRSLAFRRKRRSRIRSAIPNASA